jgi:hypothetical protein
MILVILGLFLFLANLAAACGNIYLREWSFLPLNGVEAAIAIVVSIIGLQRRHNANP